MKLFCQTTSCFVAMQFEMNEIPSTYYSPPTTTKTTYLCNVCMRMYACLVHCASRKYINTLIHVYMYHHAKLIILCYTYVYQVFTLLCMFSVMYVFTDTVVYCKMIAFVYKAYKHVKCV